MEVSVETRRRITVRGSSRQETWCTQCAAAVQMLTPGEGAALLETTARAIFRRVEAGELHFRESTNGGLRVCRNSLELSQLNLNPVKEQRS